MCPHNTSAIPKKEKNLLCEQCSNYSLYKMITSGTQYSYSGNIPCFTCIRYLKYGDNFVLYE